MLPHKLTFLTDSEVSEEFEISKYQLNPQFKADHVRKTLRSHKKAHKKMRVTPLHSRAISVFIALLLVAGSCLAQSGASLEVVVKDPTGALIKQGAGAVD